MTIIGLVSPDKFSHPRRQFSQVLRLSWGDLQLPAEINEARNGLNVDRMELNMEPGGEGKFTGGHGIRMDYRLRSDNGFVTAGYTRSKIPAWALDGGSQGSSNYVEVIRTDRTSERFAFVSGLTTNKDNIIRVVTGSGGGLGDPKECDPEAVREDIRNGLISEKRARDIYGA